MHLATTLTVTACLLGLSVAALPDPCGEMMGTAVLPPAPGPRASVTATPDHRNEAGAAVQDDPCDDTVSAAQDSPCDEDISVAQGDPCDDALPATQSDPCDDAVSTAQPDPCDEVVPIAQPDPCDEATPTRSHPVYRIARPPRQPHGDRTPHARLEQQRPVRSAAPSVPLISYSRQSFNFVAGLLHETLVSLQLF